MNKRIQKMKTNTNELIESGKFQAVFSRLANFNLTITGDQADKILEKINFYTISFEETDLFDRQHHHKLMVNSNTKPFLKFILTKGLDSYYDQVFDDIKIHTGYVYRITLTPPTVKSEEKPIVKSVKPIEVKKSTSTPTPTSKSKSGEWIRNPNTGHLIKVGGPTYKKLYTESNPTKMVETTRSVSKSHAKLPRSFKSKIVVVDDYKPRPVPTPRSYKPVPIPAPRTNKPVPASRRIRKPIPLPRKNVKQMVKEYEQNIILPPPQFRDGYKPVPAPRTIKPIEKPVPMPRTKIEQTNKALKGYTKSYEINIKNNKDPLVQLQNTRKGIESYIKDTLTSMKGIKYIETLKVTFEKQSSDEIVSKIAYFNSIAQTIINHTEIADTLQLSKQQILNKIAQWISLL